MQDVATATGRVRGSEALSGVHVWRGIPYAAPPVGLLRWRAPQPVRPWGGTRDALHFGPDFPQVPNPASRADSMSEDCLYLNLWAPADAASGSLPVMLWFHGGGFVAGSGADARCDGALLAQREQVVVVSFNYRSGVFGYLAHPMLSRESAQGVSGNYGLLDQLAALRWVADNIAGFGGDPSCVTTFGVSAGSASIALLLTAPAAEGLFQRAILHSPGTARPLASLEAAEAAGAAVNPDLDALRALSADDVLALTPRLNPTVRSLTGPRVLRPIRDGVVIREDERPVFLEGRLHRMPLIIGTNLDEGSLLTRAWPVKTAADNLALLQANFPRELERAAALYGAANHADAKTGIAAAFADTQFNYGARLLLRAMTGVGMPCWRYLFTRRRPGRSRGPDHGDEMGYPFGEIAQGRNREPEPFDDTDRKVSEAMMSTWAAFAKTADPNPPTCKRWPHYDAKPPGVHLEFGDDIRIGTEALADRLDFLEYYYAGAPGASNVEDEPT